ncbi:cytochrome P450 [Thozetella sp. PMI_491]|nr:cytochrome P450 [Thozetella sp. PMI_491]
MPEINPLAGHLLALKESVEKMPPNTVMHNVFHHISKQFPSGIFYVNLWPFSRTLLVVTTPSAASQVESFNLRAGSDIVIPIETITGGPSLMTLPIGPEWKKWRRMFSVGFSTGYMLELAPSIADQVAVFRKLLLERCSSGTSDIFQLEELTLKMTFDIIGSVALDAKLHYQIQDNPLARSMRTQIEWTSFGTTLNPFKRYLTIRPIVQWINSKRMDRYISEEIDKRFAERKNGSPPSKSIISLLMDELLQEEGGDNASRTQDTMRKTMAPQLRAFLFAGHDTTSSTLLYCYHLLSAHPEVLNRVLAEHDEVFGTDATATHSIISQDPQRLNQLPYTIAVIKEVLRIFPPAGSMRRGQPGVEIVDEEGLRYPTDGCNIWTLTLAIHHNPKYWVDVEEFKPERWMVAPDDPLYPVKGAWRPFEWGPKSCIGQTLALLELRIALVMTLREFQIEAAYEEWDTLHPRPGIKTVNGNRTYQAEKGGGGAHPADGFPVRVSQRQRAADK